MNKKIIYILIFIVLIILGIYCATCLMKKNSETVITNSNTIIVNEIEKEENKLESSNVNNELEDEPEYDNNDIETKVDETKVSEESNKETVEKQESDKEKAINLVKKKWGEDNKVYFGLDRIDDNGEYIIYVRNKSTTEAICWYRVNLTTNLVDID